MSPTLRVTLGQHSQAGRKAINQDFHGAATPTASQLGAKGLAIALADGPIKIILLSVQACTNSWRSDKKP